MNPSAVRRAIAVCAATGAFVLACCVQGVHSIEESPDITGEAQVLVFQSGRIVSGKISRSPNGYVVEHAAGRMVVPFEETRVIGDSLTDAYRRLKESFLEPTATTHYELAKWCWSHNLRDEARTELVIALDRDSDFEPARDLLERIDEQIAAHRKQRRHPVRSQAEARIVGGIELPEVESLAGLSRETAATFTTRIQPLLINKCGNASCHGPQAETEFRLEPIRGTGTGHRIYTERNLAEVLKRIDLTHLERSPIFDATDGRHGGSNRAIFFGSAGERQLQLLKSWVKTVAKEKSAEMHLQAQRPSVTGKRRQHTADSTLDAPVEESPSELTNRVQPAAFEVESASDLQDEEEQADPFDPEIFNQKYHGRGEEQSSRRPKSADEAPVSEPFP